MKIGAYLPTPFQMEVSPDLTITSPVPSVAAGKVIAAYQAVQQEQYRRVVAGEPKLEAETIPGWPETSEELARLVLGDDEWQRLNDLNVPEAFIVQATMCAVIYWGNGESEDAVRMYLEATTGGTTAPPAPKGNRAQRRSKSGPTSA